MTRRRPFSFRHWMESEGLLGVDREATAISMRLPEDEQNPAKLDQLFRETDQGKLHGRFRELWIKYIQGLEYEAAFQRMLTEAAKWTQEDEPADSLSRDLSKMSFGDYILQIKCWDVPEDEIDPEIRIVLDALPLAKEQDFQELAWLFMDLDDGAHYRTFVGLWKEYDYFLECEDVLIEIEQV